jgi:predicted PurR-regulated permease PerM
MKPVLLWPKPQSAISATLDRSPDDFTVVDTGSRYELRRLSELRSDTPILDPFPGHGKHYREFHSHIAASGCRYVISGLQPCRDVLRLGLCDEPQLVADEAPRSSGPLSRLRRAVVDPRSAPGPETFWRTAAQGASIGIFILLFGAFLDLARAILLPIVSALVIATMFGPISSRVARHHVPHWLFAALAVALLVVLLNLAIVLLSAPVIEWIGKAPEIAATIRNKLQILERPIAALHDLQNVISRGKGGDSGLGINVANFIQPALSLLTPAIGQLVLFFGTLFFFLMGGPGLRAYLVLLSRNRDARLRTLRILDDIEHNLSRYMGTVSMVNVGVGLITAIAVYLMGFPNAVLWGVLAFVFNYVPYIGPAVMVFLLFCVGLVIFPSLVYALIAPIFFAALTTIEGHFVTPNIVGRNLSLSPLIVFLALAFWTWLWGPIGAFLATPILIVGLVVSKHFLPEEEVEVG